MKAPPPDISRMKHPAAAASLCALLLLGSLSSIFGAEPERTASSSAGLVPPPPNPEYEKKIAERTDAIVAELKLGDASKGKRVRAILRDQYYALNDWHQAHDPKGKKGRAQPHMDADAQASLKAIHEHFLAALVTELNESQVERVKDLMTYNKVQFTYGAYCGYVPTMSEAQKANVLALLKTAREEAIDGGSAEEKSAVFTRYKGKINNYLATQGFDVGKAERAAAAGHGSTTPPAP